MSQTLTYSFADAGNTDQIVITVDTPASNATGLGSAFAVTSISGTIGGQAITAESGTGGALQLDQFGSTFDNAIFVNNASGLYGSTQGIDGAGLEFTVGSSLYALYSSNGSFFLSNETAGTTSAVTLTSVSNPCYCPGTLILTDRGEVAVEQLEVGDVLVTAAGQHRPIKWIGRRAYAGRFLLANPAVHPVRLRAGSLGDNLPRRDLLVSPDHALALRGVLVPAACLVNDSTITREHGMERVEYFHVELDSHDVILAEGAPAESFLDDNSRGMFSNAAEYAGPADVAPGGFCAPRVDGGPVLAAIRAEIDGLAGIDSAVVALAA